MGTPDFAVPTLELLSKHHNILAVYSQPPRPNGRGLIVKESPVQNFAKKLNIKTITPSSSIICTRILDDTAYVRVVRS